MNRANTINFSMPAAPAPPSGAAIFKLIFVILGVVAIYYLYKYLFQENAKASQVLIAGSKKGNDTLPTIAASSMAPLVEGGEYTVSMWLYVNNMVHNNGRCKHVLSIGSGLGATDDSTKFETLAVYLGPREPSLHIRTSNADSPGEMKSSILAGKFANTVSVTSESIMGADLPAIDMQRWVSVTIVMNGRTVDVYVDGKLMRSTVNTGIFRVPTGGYQMTLGYGGGFGGYLSRLQVFNYALNPEEAYRTYTAGPHGPLSALDWLKSIFSPADIEPPAYPV